MEHHLLQAAERGDAEAQFNLGVMCENASGDNRYVVEDRRPEAMKWFLAAAKQGLPRAQIKLAELYAGEPESAESTVKACGWYLRAAGTLRGAPLEKVQSAYQRASVRLTPAQIAEVRRFAQDWAPKVSAGDGITRADLSAASA
jgi:TPR repeat protein